MPLQMFKVKDFLKLFIKIYFFKTWVFELILQDFKEKVLFPFPSEKIPPIVPLFVGEKFHQKKSQK